MSFERLRERAAETRHYELDLKVEIAATSKDEAYNTQECIVNRLRELDRGDIVSAEAVGAPEELSY